MKNHGSMMGSARIPDLFVFCAVDTDDQYRYTLDLDPYYKVKMRLLYPEVLRLRTHSSSFWI